MEGLFNILLKSYGKFLVKKIDLFFLYCIKHMAILSKPYLWKWLYKENCQNVNFFFPTMGYCKEWTLRITVLNHSTTPVAQNGTVGCIHFPVVYFKHPSLMMKKLMQVPVAPNLPSGSGSCWENLAYYGLFCSISHAMRWQDFIRQILWINLQRPEPHAGKDSHWQNKTESP